MSSHLAQKQCTPCEGGTPPLEHDDIMELKQNLGGGWEVVDDHHLHRRYTFDDFGGALAFTNTIGEIAEQQGHHPDITLTYGKVDVTLCTHKIDGLTESDFILAAKIDQAQ
ncbi:MAG: 4a-hydroxytetrahydrobiopterin dehydratase [Phycisphaerae bacterium]|nr:4a-hydroxytetrahydrobiopterin dehydratase [Phycisphaerae bacterium]